MEQTSTLPLSGINVLEFGHTVMGPTCGMILAFKAQIPVAPVARPENLFEDEHLNTSEGLVTTTLPDGNKGKLPKIPLQMEGCNFRLREDPPAVGQGGTDVLRKAGFSAEEIDSLTKSGVLVTEAEKTR